MGSTNGTISTGVEKSCSISRGAGEGLFFAAGGVFPEAVVPCPFTALFGEGLAAGEAADGGAICPKTPLIHTAAQEVFARVGHADTFRIQLALGHAQVPAAGILRVSRAPIGGRGPAGRRR